MNPSDFPFLRYFPFFLCGILLGPDLPENYFLPLCGILTLLWLGYGLLLHKTRFQHPPWSAWIAYASLGCLGACLALLPSLFQREEVGTWGEGEGYLAEVQRFDLPKANSSENLLQVLAVKEPQGWSRKQALVLIYHQSERSLEPGQLLWIPTQPEVLAPPSFPHEFDYKQFLARKGIHFRQFIGKNFRYVSALPASGMEFGVERLRQHLVGWIDQYLQRPASKQIALALLLGQKESLGKEIKRAYSETGTMHILAVSGLHVGIIYTLLLLPLKSFKQEGHLLKKAYLGGVVVLIWVYALMTGFSPSVLRAVAMFTLFTLGQMRKRRPSIWNILAFSAMLMLAIDPSVAFDLGFQLSYLAVAGIVGLQPLLLRLWYPTNRVMDYFWQMATVTLAAQAVTTPLTISYFHSFPTYFLLANLLVVPLSYCILCLGVPFLLLAWIPLLGKTLGSLLDALLWIQNELTYGIQLLPAGTWRGLHLSGFGMLAIWGGLWIWGNWELGNRKWLLRLAAVLCLSWAASRLLAEVQRPAQELLFFANEKGRILDLRLGKHHLAWNQDFPPEQLTFSVLPHRLATQRAAQPQGLQGIAQGDSLWFPGIDVVFFPSQSRLLSGKIDPGSKSN